MFEFIDKSSPVPSHSQSLVITYPRTVDILYGYYPYLADIHNFILEIKEKISKEHSYKSNVKGGKTPWKAFVDHSFTSKFIQHCILKHQTTHPYLFENFLSKQFIKEAWGTEIKEGDYVTPHHHSTYNAILYLTDGNPLLLPELNLKIHPKPGDYYFFPPQILHGVEASTSKKNRYNLVLNIETVSEWDLPSKKS